MDGLGSQSGGNAWFEIADVIWSEADSILAESSETRRLISDSLSDQWEQESCTVFDSKFEELKNGGSFKNIKRRGGDERFAESVLEKGTLSDKISSMSVLLQENPIKHHHHLSKLIGMASSPARRVSNLAIEALTDLFSNYILPPSRKLRRFKNPIMLRRISALVGNAQWEDALFYAQWEDWLKIRFAEFVAALESLSMNTIENLRLSACNGAYSILKQRPEGEQALLSIIVNKLGDSSGKLADRVSHLLLELSKSFPQMRSVVKKEIDQIIFRNHVHVRAQRFGVLCLSQMKLSVGDREFAESLIETYIQLFEVEMKKRSREEKPSPHTNEDEKSLESKLLSCILTGINRALPYCREGDKKTSFSDRLIKRLDSLFRIVHSSNWAASVQCLGLLLQIVTDGQEFSGKLGDRFYRALYDRMIRVDRIFNGSSKLALFLNILYRSMKLDANTDRVLAFAKRLLQVSLYQQPEFICGALFLIARVHSQNGFLSGLMSLPPDGDLAESDVYDPMKRDPAYSNVKNSCLWELVKSKPVNFRCIFTNVYFIFRTFFYLISILQCANLRSSSLKKKVLCTQEILWKILPLMHF